MENSINTVIHDTIDKFSPEEWNGLSNDSNPFVSFEFFKALEKGNCVKEQSGWHPLYFATLKENQLQCAMVAYIKTDSYGEFIFDWEWARAYQQYGLPYYPKLTVAVPYSPISAPKVLGDQDLASQFLLPYVWSFYQREAITGLHFLFTEKEEERALGKLGLKERHSFQYHWLRGDCDTFDDYLTTLRKNRRKSIKKERRSIENEEGLSFTTKNASEISSDDLDFFYECYITTIDKKWSQAYLSHAFFKELIQTRGQDVFLVMANQQDKPIACALYLKSKDTLFGRYWGCQKELDYLHFELCIYRGIELTLKLNLQKFEAGAQGEHKRMRGFKPVLTKSYHHLKEPQFFDAVAKFLDREKEGIEKWFEEFAKDSPLKEERQKAKSL